MKKRAIIFVIVMLLTVLTSFGQVVLTSEDQGLNPRASTTNPEFGVMVPMQNINLDQYKQETVPLGEGWLLLAFLGGAWGMKKKWKVESRKLKDKK